MKKGRLLLGLALISMVTTGCDFLDNISGGGNHQEEKKDDEKKTIEPESISLNVETIVLNVDESYTVEPTVLPQEASQEVKFESFNRDVAIVYANGVVYGANEGETTVRVSSKIKESVYRDIYVIVEEELPPTPLTNQVITASSDNPYSDEAVTLTTNAPTATWSIVSGVSYAHLSATTGKNVNLIGDAAGSVTVKATATEYTEATKTIIFNTRPVGTYYDVTFNSNGGSTSPAKKSVEENGTFTFPSPGTKTHYTFLGWSSDSGTTKYAIGATSPAVTGNITYTAYWQEDAKYTVTYTAGANGTGSYAHTDQYQGTYTLLGFESLNGILASNGYQFSNYTVNGVNKNPGDSITLSSVTTVTVNFAAQPDPDDYYSSITANSGTSLLGQIHDLSVSKHTYYNSYSADIASYAIKTDPYDSTSLRDFYTGAPIKNQSTSSGNGAAGFNREHVWPKSLSNGVYVETGGGADLQHIRPCIPKINSDRGNMLYGELNNTGTASTSTDLNGKTVQGGYKSGNTFQPMNDKKGDAARIIMYVYMHYNKASNIGGTTDGKASSYVGTLNFTLVMDANDEAAAKQLLLAWNAADPVDDIERLRNDEVAKITGCRNPFIDHPEYASKIWGN